MRGKRSGERARFVGRFKGFTELWTAGCLLARTGFTIQGLHHHGPRYFRFAYFCKMYGLEKLGLVDQNWLERNLSALLLKTLFVGRRQQSESIEVALDME